MQAEKDYVFNDGTEVLKVQLPASRIPDRATVCKVTGSETYTLRRDIRVYVDAPPKKKKKGDDEPAPAEHALQPMEMKGFFLVNRRGDINQLAPDKTLCWIVTAAELWDELQCSLDWDIRCPQ